MKLDQIEVYQIQKRIDAEGEKFDLKDCMAVIEKNELRQANGAIYNKEGICIGSFNYDSTNQCSINVNGFDNIKLVYDEINSYLDAISKTLIEQ